MVEKKTTRMIFLISMIGLLLLLLLVVPSSRASALRSIIRNIFSSSNYVFLPLLYSSNDGCESAEYVGKRCGDLKCGGFSCPSSSIQGWAIYFDSGSRWFRTTAMECSSCFADIYAEVYLVVPEGNDYDLYVYKQCGELWKSSNNGSGLPESIVIDQAEDIGIDNSFDYITEVRFKSGDYSSEWALEFIGTNCE